MLRFWNQILFFISIFSFGFLCFLYGVIFTQFDKTPLTSQAIASTYALIYDFYNQHVKPDSYQAKTFYWLPARYEPLGAVMHQEEQYFGEYNLILSGHQQGADLLDRLGQRVHHWTYPYQNIYVGSAQTLPDPKTIYWWKSHLFANGDLLSIVTVDNRSPSGVGLIKLDKDSNLIWHFPGHVHHDFDVDQQGNIYALLQGFSKGMPGFLSGAYLDEAFVVLDAQGNLKKQINIYQAIANSPYKHILKRLPKSIAGDYLHVNAIEFVDEKKSAYADYLQANSVLLDLRELDAIIMVDLETELLVGIISGPWHRQHDPELLANGNLLIFDNKSLGYQSRVIEFDPRSRKIIWEYRGTDELPLYSSIRAGQQALGNGNVFIYESNGSRLLEVNRTGELVWEYYHPVRAHDEGSTRLYAPVIMSAARYRAEELDFIENNTGNISNKDLINNLEKNEK